MPPRAYTRVAVAQLACLPAIALPGRAPFEDPLFELAHADALRPEGEPPPELDACFSELRERIARVHREQLLLKVQAILGQCQRWGVRLIVFPEYSLPWQVLEQVARAGGDLVIVAGTHSVTRPARQSGIYERLGGQPPALGQAVCPVLHRGRLLGLQPKLSLTEMEQELRPGQTWCPIPIEGLPGPMGVLICLDFLHREGEAHRKLVAEALEQSHFLAVPSYTPFHTIPEFHAKAQEEAQRYGRPVLWADVAVFSGKKAAGGSSIFVDEGHAGDLRRFPEHAGYLEPGDEGVIVADVDLGFARVGPSTRYDQKRPIVPFAAAGLVYPVHPAGERYAQWLAQVEPLLEREDDEAVEALAKHVTEARTVLQDAGASNKAREARLRRLSRELDSLVSMEQFRRYTREIVLPPQALPLPSLRAVLAGGAADALFEWQKDWRGFGLGPLVQRLHEASRSVSPPDPGEWTEAGSTALESVRRAVRHEPSGPEPTEPVPEAEVRWAIPAGIDPAALGELRRGGFVFRFRPRPEDFRAVTHESPARRAAAKAVHGEGVSGGVLLAAQELFLLTVAEASGPTAAMAVAEEGQLVGAILPITHAGEHWAIQFWDADGWWRAHGPRAQQALEEELRKVELQRVSTESGKKRLEALRSRFEKGRERVEKLRAERLSSVKGAFVQPTVRVGEAPLPALEALDQWLDSGNQTALVLGEYGAGKSTTLAVWCSNLWSRDEAPRPLLCSLASATTGRDAHGLLLDAAGTEDTSANRAALRLLIRTRKVLPVFDGFDEMATRLGSGGLAGRLSELLGVAEDTGRVVVSSREHYFESETTLHSTAAEALRQALGASSGLTRLTFLPFEPGQIRELMEKNLSSRQEVDEALRRIQDTYDLMDLVKRPLLLGMVLASLDRIAPTARVAPADIYEAYLQHWLSQTSEDSESLTHAQKQEFAEALAEELWRSGRTSCSWRELRKTVRERMGRQLPDHLTPAAVFRDIEGGAFFVREGEENYRFAHKSFLEYFLARALVETLEAQKEEALDTRPFTREVAAFLGEVLRRRTGDALQSGAVLALQALLRARGVAGGSAGPAAANAFRLLHGLAVWARDGRQWLPERADLRRVDLTGEDLRGARLGSALMEGARLSGSDLSGADLAGADLSQAVLVGVRLEGTSLRGANATGADFTLAEATRCDAVGANLSRATLSQSVWWEGRWEGAELSGAEVTAALMVPEPPQATPQLAPRSLQARIATGHSGPVWSVSWSEDGRRLASAGEDGTVRLWDAESGRELRSLSGHSGRVLSVSWSEDGRRLASAGDDGLCVWDTVKYQLLVKWLVAGPSSLASTPGGYCLFNGDPSRHGLSVSRPERPETLLYLPLPQTLRTLLEQPDKVRAALEGSPGDSSELTEELAARGWTGGEPWDGERHHVPETAPKAAPPPPSAEALPSSPFRPGSALEEDGLLVGREATVSELLALVTGRSPAILLGPRRAGKTWLLEHMSHRLSGAGYTVRYESLQGRPPRSADELALLLEPELATSPPRGSSPSAELLRKLGKHTQRKPGKSTRAQAKALRHVYLLDEVGALDRGDETLFPWLRELGQRQASLVLAGSHWDWVRVIRRANEVCPGSSFGNDFTPVVLEPIPQEEARRFLTEAVPGLIPEHVADWILDLCGEWPFYLQTMGHALYFAREAGNRKPFNDKAALAELYDQRLLAGRIAVFEDRLRELPEAVKQILFTHRERRPEFHTLPPEERTLLVDTGLCTEAGRWLADRPFFDWLRRRAAALDP